MSPIAEVNVHGCLSPPLPQRRAGDRKVLLLGEELLMCVLGSVCADVEKSLIEVQLTGVVPETRSAFQVAMEHRFISAVERLSGREVLSFTSAHHVGPGLKVELFMLKPLPRGVESSAGMN